MTSPSPQCLKPHLSFEDQLAKLVSRGMAVDDPLHAIETLQRLGYYRLSGYWYPFRQTNPRGVAGRQDGFQDGTSFELIAALYEFDRHLRLLVLDAVERIEVALRVDIGYRLGKKNPLAHECPELLDGKFNREINAKTGHTAYEEWSRKMADTVGKAKDEFVKHHRSKYGGKMPIWVITELWELGHLSKFFAGMQYGDQRYIAKRYGVDEPRHLVSWLRAINFIRNVSAHHGRLWNRNVVDAPSFPVTQPHHHLHHVASDTHAIKRVYAVLCIVQRMLHAINPENGSCWVPKLKALCAAFPPNAIVSLRDAGFVDGWEERTFWHGG